MRKIIRLTESDLIRLVKRVIKEQDPGGQGECITNAITPILKNLGIENINDLPACKALTTPMKNVTQNSEANPIECATQIVSKLSWNRLSEAPKIMKQVTDAIQNCLGGAVKF